MQKICYVFKEKFENKYENDKRYCIIIQGNLEALTIAYIF